jgi:hypothetical protein
VKELHIELIVFHDQDGFGHPNPLAACSRGRPAFPTPKTAWRRGSAVDIDPFNLDKNPFGKANVKAMAKTASMPRKAAELLAVQALTFLAQEPERLGRFLALAGIGPESLRAAASEPGFLAGILDHVASEETLLLAFAAHAGIAPADVAKARIILSGPPGENEIP